MTSAGECFSSSYGEARERFRDLADHAGAELEALPLPERGPAGEALTIDLARLGDPAAPCRLIVQSGIHGVEAFAGAAIQLQLLRRRPRLRDDVGVILIHVINPYGMAWLRRTNGHNVDLNRNCLRPGEQYQGAPSGYRELDSLINPPSPPAPDGFLLRAAGRVCRYGLGTVKAVASGQYEYPRGLFFGGRELQPEPLLLAAWLRRSVAGASRLLVLDLHTGLGPRGRMTLFPEVISSAAGPTLNLWREMRRRHRGMRSGEAWWGFTRRHLKIVHCSI